MSNRTGLFVNVNNLFHYIAKRWEGKRLNYNEFINAIDNSEEYNLVIQIAYGTHHNDSVQKFQNALQSVGFELKYKLIEPGAYYTWDAGMAVDMCTWAEKLDNIIIGAGNRELVPVVEYLKSRGVKVTVYAATIHKELRQAAHEVVEIEEWMLIDPAENNNDNERSADN